jgi:hypothetical protein
MENNEESLLSLILEFSRGTHTDDYLKTLYEQLNENEINQLANKIIKMIEDRNFDPNEIYSGYGFYNGYSPLMMIVELITEHYMDTAHECLIKIFHKLLESNLARVDYICPTINESALSLIFFLPVDTYYYREIAFHLIDRTDYNDLINRQYGGKPSRYLGISPKGTLVERAFFSISRDSNKIIFKIFDRLTKPQVNDIIDKFEKNIFIHLRNYSNDRIQYQIKKLEELRQKQRKQDVYNVNLLKPRLPEDLIPHTQSFLPKGGKSKRKCKTNKRKCKTNKRKTHTAKRK